MTKQILMIEDDLAIVELVRIHLLDLPGELIAFSSGTEGLNWLSLHRADLCILDVMLPDMNGIDICRTIRQQDENTPILMLTAKVEEQDKVLGLITGADDYVTKPFGIQEFVARVKALLRRSERSNAGPQTPGTSLLHGPNGLVIDQQKRIVLIAGRRIELTPIEFDLLVLLAASPGKSYSRKELLSLVWGYTFDGYEHTVTAHVNRLRNKIEPDFSRPICILTAWGIGYRFADITLTETT